MFNHETFAVHELSEHGRARLYIARLQDGSAQGTWKGPDGRVELTNCINHQIIPYFAVQTYYRASEPERHQVCADMKGASGVIIAALCIVLALSSSQCSGLVHTAEPLPVGQLLSRAGMPSGRQLLASTPQDLEGASPNSCQLCRAACPMVYL